MENKSFTVLIASNRHHETIKLTLSARKVKVLGFLSFCLILALATACFDYFGLLLKANENRSLKAENSALKNQFLLAEERLTNLEASVERIQNFTKKLNLITNVEDDERVMKLALSENSRNATAAQMQNAGASPAAVNRLPSSEFTIREPQIPEKIFTDEKSGELGVTHETARDFNTLSVRIDRALRSSQLREQGVLQLWESLSSRQSLLSSTPSIKPTHGWYTSRFGYRADPFTNRPTMHPGLDLAAPPGTPIYATADGTVTFVGYDNALGKVVSIDHGYGVVTKYAHNSRIFVEQGQKVHRWDVISAVGNSGRSTGPHLYYEVRIHGLPVDPINYILAE